MQNTTGIYLRGKIWWVKVHVDGNPIYESSKSTRLSDAVKLRDRKIAQKVRGEINGGTPDKVLLGELLDDVLKSDIAESTRTIWRFIIDGNSTRVPPPPPEKTTYGNLRPFFGNIKAARLTTAKLEEYRAKRKAEGVKDSTVNRELAILRTAMHNGRKRTPPKVLVVPYFPIVDETANARQGFLPDDVYAKILNALPDYLRPLFVVGYNTGIRKGELLKIRWDQVDFQEGVITLYTSETKGRQGRGVPILEGDMKELLLAAKADRDKNWPKMQYVFARDGERIEDFRTAWNRAAEKAGVPELTFHDLRRTSVRNMRRAGVPQVVRMAISGHKTDSMERRYNIVDVDDLTVAKRFMEARIQSLQSTVTINTKTVAVENRPLQRPAKMAEIA